MVMRLHDSKIRDLKRYQFIISKSTTGSIHPPLLEFQCVIRYHAYRELLNFLSLSNALPRFTPTISLHSLGCTTPDTMALFSWNECYLFFGLSLPVLALFVWAYLVRSEMKQEEEKKKIQ
jgi:hypothetical protein